MNARIESLHLIESACWREIERATRESEHAFRLMSLATIGADGGAEARHVVLREVRTTPRELVFYTDERSPKLAQIRAQPRGTLLCWSPVLGWQLRLRVDLATMADGQEVNMRWTRLKLSPAAHDYLSPLAPGTPLGQPGNERGSRGFFTVVCARVRALDWLELHADGHRRAIFDDQGARWVQP